MVELRDLTKTFGDFVAVRGVNLTIQAGEFITLLGPSGCGKTTVLRMISGFEIPTRGSVWLDGKDVTHVPPYDRDVNQVFQSYALFPHLSVDENIAFGLRMKKRPKKEIRERVQKAIALVSLQGNERKRPSELSGGQRQRVALARALICEPKVLLLDEPLSALDAKLRKQMQIELKRLQQKLGITFVFVTHDQEEALAMSDRIAVVNEGRIEQIGTPSEIYRSPASTFVATFVGEANLLSGWVRRHEGGKALITLTDQVVIPIEAAALTSEAKEVMVSVRPEKIHLTRSPVPGEHSFEAVVTEQLFKGCIDHLVVRTTEGLELDVIAANESATQDSFHVGDRVYCTVHSSDVVLVRDAQGGR